MTRPDDVSVDRRRPLRHTVAFAAGAALAASLLFAAPAHAESPYYYPVGTVQVVDVTETEHAGITTVTTVTTTLDGHGTELAIDTVNGEGSSQSRRLTEFTYDDSGLRVLAVTRFYRGGSAILDSTEVIEYQYDKHGELSSVVITRSDASGTVIQSSTTTTREGTPLTVTRVDTAPDGTRTTVVAAYDLRGRPVSETTTTVDPAGATVSTRTVINTYTQRGSIASQVTTTEDAGGLQTESTTLEYDNQDLLQGFVTVSQPSGETQSGSIEYDSKGRQVLYATETRSGAGDLIESSTNETTYDGKGGVVSTRFTSYDGTGNAVYWQHSEYTLDDSGNVVESVTTTDYGKIVASITYDKKGHLLTVVKQSFSPSDALRDTTTETRTLDAKGRLLGFVLTLDEDGDGVDDVIITFTSTIS